MEKEGWTNREKGERQTYDRHVIIKCVLMFGRGCCDGLWNHGYPAGLD